MTKHMNTHRFLVVQALGAANDNLVKQATLVLFSFGLIPLAGAPSLWTNLASGLFILPFLVFSGFAGRWAARQDFRDAMVRIKLIELACVSIACLGLVMDSAILLLISLFLLGLQSTFFGPIKFSWPPRAVAKKQLPQLTGQIEALTFLAILLGSLAGGALVNAQTALMLLILGLAAIGLWMAWTLAPMPADQAKVTPYHDRADIRRARLLISWFWFLGASYLTQLGLLARELMDFSPEQVSYCLAAFAIGVAIGSPLARRARHSLRLGWLGLIVLGLTLPLAAQINAVLGLMVLGSLGVAGGLYVVPLYVTMQLTLDRQSLPQAIARNNQWNAGFMIASAGFGITTLSIIGIGPALYFVVLASLSLVWLVPVWRSPGLPIQGPDRT